MCDRSREAGVMIGLNRARCIILDYQTEHLDDIGLFSRLAEINQLLQQEEDRIQVHYDATEPDVMNIVFQQEATA